MFANFSTRFAVVAGFRRLQIEEIRWIGLNCLLPENDSGIPAVIAGDIALSSEFLDVDDPELRKGRGVVPAIRERPTCLRFLDPDRKLRYPEPAEEKK